jgi:phage shock protein A
MANPFVKAWKYLMALFSSKGDEYADPKVQIQQAIEDAQRQHAALSQQAAAVIGNQRQLEMKLNRQLGEVERLQTSAKQAIVLADQARAQNDAEKSAKYEQTAQVFATQLVSAEQQMEDLKSMHDQALQAAEQAKKAVEQNAVRLQQKLAERTKLLSQLDQAKMQEQISSSLKSMSELNAPGTTPTLDEVREKIERRYANALGATELSKNSVEGRMLEVEMSTIDMAGSARLDQLRAQLHPELADAAKPAITGSDTAAESASAATPAAAPAPAPAPAPTEQA